MKRTAQLLTLALCITAVIFSSAPRAKAQDTLSAAYNAYYNFLQEQTDLVGTVSTDFITAKHFNSYGENTAWTLTSVDGASLIDFDASGIPELVLNKSFLGPHQYATDSGVYIYTYYNGQIVNILSAEYSLINGEWTYVGSGRDFIWTDAYGRSCFVNELSSDGTANGGYVMYGYRNGQWQVCGSSHSEFRPDIYISQQVHTSTGKYEDYINAPVGKVEQISNPGTLVSNEEYWAYNNSYRAAGDKAFALDTVNNTLYTLSTLVDPTYAATYRSPSAWAAETVSSALARGIVPGHLQKKYTTPITRGEFCELATLYYQQATGSIITERAYFADTDGESIQKMAGLGVVNGVGNNNFAPNSLLTREEAAVILSRLAKALGNSSLAPALNDFADAANISSWALEGVRTMSNAGIMGGVGNNLFDPKSNYTREQSILTLMRLDNVQVPVTGIEVNAEMTTLNAGTSVPVTVKVLPENATNKHLTVTSSDSSIASGTVKAISGSSAGSAAITYTAKSGASTSVSVTVRPEGTIVLDAKIPAKVNVLQLQDGEKAPADADIGYLPEKQFVIGVMKVTDVEPKKDKDGNLTGVLKISGVCDSVTDGIHDLGYPYLKWILKNADGSTADSGIVPQIFATMREKGDEFSCEITPEIPDYNKSYTLEFVSDEGTTLDDLMDEAPTVKLPKLPFSVESKNGDYVEISHMEVVMEYKSQFGYYSMGLAYSGEAEQESYMSAKFKITVTDSSGKVVAKSTTYITQSAIADDGTFYIQPSYDLKNIKLEAGESYRVTIEEA